MKLERDPNRCRRNPRSASNMNMEPSCRRSNDTRAMQREGGFFFRSATNKNPEIVQKKYFPNKLIDFYLLSPSVFRCGLEFCWCFSCWMAHKRKEAKKKLKRGLDDRNLISSIMMIAQLSRDNKKQGKQHTILELIPINPIYCFLFSESRKTVCRKSSAIELRICPRLRAWLLSAGEGGAQAGSLAIARSVKHCRC